MARLLFIQAARETAAEYDVSRLLAEYVDQERIDSFFIWQKHTQSPSEDKPARLKRRDRNFYYDFGRDMSLDPAPSRSRRARMMLRQLPGAVAFLISKVKQIRPDAIYTTQQGYDVWMALMLRSIFNIPHVLHLQYPVGPWLGVEVLHTIRNTDRIIADSAFVARGAIEAGVPAQRIRIVHNPANVAVFNVERDRATIRREFGWHIDTPLIVSAGRLDPSKGHMLLVNAFDHVRKEFPEARVLICGDTTTKDGYAQLLKQRVVELGLDSNVTFVGYRNDLPTILAGADIFCLPTENDACPLVFLCAMAASVPAVGCYSGGVPEMVIDQKTGLLSQLSDIEGLANNLLQLLRNPTLATQFGQAGKERALTEFSPPYIAAQWLAILEEFLPAKGPSAYPMPIC